MIIIFDLDYTLFDAKKFRAGIAAILNLSLKEFDEKYHVKYFKSKKINYNFKKNLEIIKGEDKDLNTGLLEKKFDKFLLKINKYLFPEAEEILRRLKRAGHILILFTFGDKELQKQKVDNLRIKKYFAKIVFTAKEKNLPFNFLKNKKEKIYIINDNAKESLLMKKYIKKGEIILIKGPYSYNAKHNLRVRTRKQLLNFINNL